MNLKIKKVRLGLTFLIFYDISPVFSIIVVPVTGAVLETEIQLIVIHVQDR